MKGQEMQKFQKQIINKKTKELTTIADNIDELRLSKNWTIIFTNMCCYRCWKKLNKTQQSQMKNIADIDSGAIELIIAEKFKKVGLDLIEMIALELIHEKERIKAVEILLDKGAKKGYQDVLLLIAKSKHESQKSKS